MSNPTAPSMLQRLRTAWSAWRYSELRRTATQLAACRRVANEERARHVAEEARLNRNLDELRGSVDLLERERAQRMDRDRLARGRG